MSVIQIIIITIIIIFIFVVLIIVLSVIKNLNMIIFVSVIIFTFTDFWVPLFFVVFFCLHVLICYYFLLSLCFLCYDITFIASIIIFINVFFCFLVLFWFLFLLLIKQLIFSYETVNVSKLLCLFCFLR